MSGVDFVKGYTRMTPAMIDHGATVAGSGDTAAMNWASRLRHTLTLPSLPP